MADAAFAFVPPPVAPVAPPVQLAPPAPPPPDRPTPPDAPKFDDVLNKQGESQPEPQKRDAQPDKPAPQADAAPEDTAAAPQKPDVKTATATPDKPADKDAAEEEPQAPVKTLTSLDGLFAALAAPWQAFERMLNPASPAAATGAGSAPAPGAALPDIFSQLAQRLTALTARIETLSASAATAALNASAAADALTAPAALATPLAGMQDQLDALREAMKLLTGALQSGKTEALEKPEFAELISKISALPGLKNDALVGKVKEASALLDKLGGLPAIAAAADVTAAQPATTVSAGEKHAALLLSAKPEVPVADSKPVAVTAKLEAPKVTTDTDNTSLAANTGDSGKQSGDGETSDGSDTGQNFSSLLPPQQPGQLAPPKAADAPVFSKLVEQQAATPNAPAADQLLAHVKVMASRGDSRIQIQLHPAELGWLDIRLEVTGEGKANLNITADNSKTLDMLRSDVRVLERMLTDIGLKADSGSLSFNLRGEQSPGNPYSRRDDSKYGTAEVEPEITALEGVSHEYSVAATEGLDIRI